MKGSLHRVMLVVLFASGVAGCVFGGGRSQPKGDVLFADDFEGSAVGGWLLEGDDQGQAEVVNGRLLITIRSPGTVQYATLEDRVFSDAIVDVDATQIGGAPGSSYGILFRMVAPQQFYRFEVTSNGEYAVERHDASGEWERLTDGWQSSTAIRTGLDETNRLRVAAAGGRLTFYANDTLLTQVFDGSYATGAIALDAGTFNQNELQVAFDNVVVLQVP